ncbi:pyruvate dehydrogenase (acetyl-transferring) E1 component subunit alpha [Polymorphum gilvum]|uniref:Pyruvate dehydrogenase E1 component subunit alpha n=1 Tax=Polymorphum gilvum (strain LMG 25793 / CGMCC 1.9160 / SL003B-26A1) TaxID=991905 RepID=F2IYR4_POLGS|nr:pyruvate dehydrogenase (acetyl-transferring) E1 component subunit alpha [Polymorphum gilvum]ADZ69511.1 Pyruvate dehydrogenase (Acetyl-transferring) E1 component, alpha subunit [Polymorphum gilvum SL003B-26A1]
MAEETDPTVRTVVRFDVRMTRHLLPDGTPVGTLPDFARDPAELERLYRAMVLTRAFDEKAVALQRTGRLGTFASSLGQEAVSVGLAAAMRAEDILVPSFREQGAQLWRGVSATEIFLFWGGDERGSDFAGPRQDFPVCIPVASQFPHAVGAALALKLRGEPRVAVCVAGDGATSKGDFYEALNIAGAWAVPAVFVIADNQWAISVRRQAQTAAGTLAQKAVAAGIPGEQVDGNDVVAVRAVVARAVERARLGEGPSLVEAITYRLADHTTADDARRYRDPAEVSEHWKEEPVARLRNHLIALGAWTREDEERALEDSQRLVAEAAEAYLATPPAPATAMFDHLYETLPAALAAQRAEALAQEASHG